MNWDLPFYAIVDGEKLEIERECDYKVALDCLLVYEDPNIDLLNQHRVAAFIFYKDPRKIKNFEGAVKEMVRILNGDQEYAENSKKQVAPPRRLMSWAKDFKHIAPAINRVLGYDIRDPRKYTHWWTFLSAYHEIGECGWATIISIRKKKQEGKKLEKWEEKFYRENYDEIYLPIELTDEEKEMLNAPW